MDNITSITSQAFERYFTSLSKLGYSPQSNVNIMITLAFIEELLTEGLSEYITEDDYSLILNALYCLMGSSCLIDLPNYTTWDSIFHKSKELNARLSEDNICRITEDMLVRQKA